MKKKITLFSTLSLLTVFGISSIVFFFMCQANNAKYADTLEKKEFGFIDMIAGIIWILCLTVSTTTIYLNTVDRVRETRILRFLSFFLMPLTISSLFWFSGDKGTNFDSFYKTTICFLILLAFAYIRFIRIFGNYDKE
jgi:hypothetical protein